MRGQGGGTPPALAVSASADTTTPTVGDAVTVSAQITGSPAGSPAYRWEMDYGGGWFTLSTEPTASYLTTAPETVRFRVTVSYGSGESATSEPVSITFAAAAPPEEEAGVEKPAAPTGLTVDATAGSLDATLDWDDVAGADDYLVRWRLAGPGQSLNAGVRSTASLTTISVVAVGAYVVRVEACNEAGCGAPVASSFEVEPLAPPDAPSNLKVADAEGELQVDASWDGADGATSYRLTWQPLSAGSGLGRSSGLPGDSLETAAAAARATVGGSGLWQFILTACNEAGCSDPVVGFVEVKDVVGQQSTITGPSTPVQSFVSTSPVAAGAADANMNTHDHALQFTTGPNTGGYRLTQVRVQFGSQGTSLPTYSLKVCTGTDSNPATDCSTGTLVNPTTLGTPGVFTNFTTSGNGITLDASTSYYVVLDTTTPGTGTYSLRQTRSDDSTNGVPGWSVATASLRKAQASGSTWGADPNGDALRIGFSGYTRASGAPTLEGLEIDGATLIASFDRDLDAGAAPVAGQFGIKVGSGALQAATAIHVSGRWAVLTVPAVTSGQTVTATYSKPNTGNKLKDRDGNEVAGFSDQAVTNHTGTTPSLSSAVLDGYDIELTYDRFLDQSSIPDRGQFKYKRDGGAALSLGGITRIGGSHLLVPVSDRAPPTPEQTVTVSYTQPASNKFQDAWGNDVPALTDQAVENRTPLVANFGLTLASYSADAKYNRDQAQAFTTGSHAGGYTLTSVVFRLQADSGSTAPNYTVSIHSANAGGTPGTTNHGTLTNPSKLVVGDNTFTAPAGGIELKPNTTYAVVVDLANSGDKFYYRTTTGDTESGAAGWSIANTRSFRFWNTSTWKSNTNVLYMAIQADYRAAAPADLTGPPEQILVRNNSQTGADGRGISAATFDMAQAFTTGTHQHGYVLNSVNILFGGSAKPPTFNVKVCSGSDTNPIASCPSGQDLTLSGALRDGLNTFTAGGGGIELTRGTTYYVVLTTTAAGGASGTAVATSNSDAEDFQQIGWSIANGLLASTHGSTTWNSVTDSWRMQVLGRAKQSGAPTLESLEIDGTTLVATFNRILDSSAAPAAGQFGIKIGSGALQNATAVSVSGRRAVLTVPAVTSGQTVTATYTKPGSGNKLKDIDGNEVATYTDRAVTNRTGVNPSLSSAEVDGNRMTLAFNRSLKEDSGTNPVAFEYKVGSGAWVSARVDALGISGKQVEYLLRDFQIPSLDQTVLVRYRQPAINKLKDAWDSDVPAVISATATNSSPLVSNHRQSVNVVLADNDGMGGDQAQPFTTGSHADGYTLTAVDLWLLGAGGSTEPNFTVSIHAADTDGKPTGTSLGTLTKPSTLGVGLNTFTAPGGINLKANTTYVVFADSTTTLASRDSYPVAFGVTGSNDEDSGASAGWSIADGKWQKGSEIANFPAVPSSTSLRMLIRGEFGQNAETSAPAAPSGLSAASGNAQAALSWTDPGNTAIDKYQYRVSADGGTTWSPDWTDVPSSSATTTSYTVTGLTNGTDYTIQLRAVDGTTNGASASVSVTPARKLVGNVVAGGWFQDAASQDIRTSFTTGAQAATLTHAGISVHTLGTPPTTYELELWSTGAGAARLATFTKPSALAVGQNTFTLATAQSLSASTTYALIWDQGEAASTFRLGRAGNHHEDGNGLTGWGIGNGASRRAHGSTAAFGNPSGGATLLAVYGYVGTSTAPAAPAAPTGLTATPGDAQAKLSWTDPSNSNITKYQGRQSTDGGSTWSAWQDIASSDATTTSDTLTGLTNGTTYTFQIRAVAGTTNGASASVSVTPAAQLVKNLNKSGAGAADTNIVANDAAQAFTTGSNSTGYILNYIILGAGGAGTPPGPGGYSVKVCNNDSSGSSDVPGTTCTDLSEPAALAGGGADVFAASAAGMSLSASTKYWVVFDSVSGGSGTWVLRRTLDEGEDTGAAAGVTIANDGLTRARAATTWSSDSNPLKIGIYGYAKAPLAAPAGLAATPGDNEVALSWTVATDARVTGYQYRISDDGGTSWDPDWTDVPSSGAATTSYTVTGLSIATSYTIELRAVAGTANGASASVSATTTTPPPAAPAGLSATPGLASVTLNWTDPGNATITKYQIRSRPSGGSWGPWAEVGGSDATTTSDTVSLLTNGTTYTFQVRAVAGTVFGHISSVSATPAAQLIKNLDKTATSGTDIVANDAAQAFTTGSNGPGYTLSYVRLALNFGTGSSSLPTDYSVKVCNDSAGAPGATCTDLISPSSLTATGNHTFAAAPAGIVLSASTTYWMVFDTVSGGSGGISLRRTSSDGQDSGAAAGWGIGDDGHSRGKAATGAWTSGTNAHKIGIYGYARTGPPPPGSLSATPSRGQARLTWTAVAYTGITKYQYRASADGGTSWDPDWSDVPGGAGATSYTVRNLTDGATYTIQVRAVAGALTGTAASVTADLPYLPARAPSGLSPTAGDGQIALTWTDPSDSAISKYQFRQQAGGGDWTDWADVPSSGAATTTYTVTGLTNWTRYTIELRAVRGTGALISSGASASVSASPNGPFVSNIGQTDFGLSTDLSVWDAAQDFTTGSHALGYTLTEVKVSIRVPTGGNPDTSGLVAMICPAASSGGPDYTDSETHNCLTPALTVPTAADAGLAGLSGASAVVSLTAGAISLSANTTYFVVLDGGTGAQAVSADMTADTNDEDAGAAAGWSVGKDYHRRNQTNTSWTDTAGSLVRFAVVGRLRTPVFVGGGGFGGTPTIGPDKFQRNTERELTPEEIETLAAIGGTGSVTGSGEAVLVVQDSDDGPRLVLYSRIDGELQATLEIELDPQNASPRSQTSEGSTAWVLDDEAETLFAYDLKTGERKSEADIELDTRYGLPQAVSAVSDLILTLHNPLLLYDRATGALLGEFTLDRSNRDPRGAWSDGVTVWVSDHAAARIFAYRLPELSDRSDTPDASDLPDDQQRQLVALERVPSEEFTLLRRAGNTSPRGIWSDGEVMYVADEQDGKVYAYNMPAEIDARLASLSLSEIDLGEFSAHTFSYAVDVGHEIEHVTVAASPAREAATVMIGPDDADSDPENGHQVAVGDGEPTRIEITVTSEDERRTRVYVVVLERANRAPLASELPLVELTAGGEPAQLNLSDYFTDPDGDELSYTLGESWDAEVISAAQAKGVLTLTPLSAGTASFDVFASDGELESEPRTIEVNVEPPPVEVRFAARRNLADWVELGLQVRAEDGSWGERILPRQRFIRASAELGRWLSGSAIEVGEGAAARTLRFDARRLAGGWVEFALRVQAEDGSWSARSPLSARVLLPGQAGQWDHSASLGVGAAGVTTVPDDGQPPSEPDTSGVDDESSAGTVEVRLAARPLASGEVEFGLQERNDGGDWRERLLPRLRFLQTDSEVGRWRVSSAIEVGEGDAAGTVRIAARRIASGRVEFALVVRNEDGSWSARLLPRARILPSDSATGQWRYSTPLVIGSR